MKKILLAVILALLMLGVCVTGAGATYWTPTESGIVDVNYTSPTDIAGNPISINGDIAIFDDSDSSFLTPLILKPFDTIYFIENSGDWGLSRSADGSLGILLTLSGSSQFQLAFKSNASGSSWVSNSGYTPRSDGLYTVYWGTSPSDVYASITQIDAEPSAVPIPAAVWLLGSGLLGLFGIRRRSM